MKKLVFVFAFLILFSGCSKTNSVTSSEVAEVYKNGFSASVLAEFGENKAEIKAAKNGMSISLTLVSPAELSGMELEITDEHVKVIYEGMEQTLKKDTLPKGTPFLLLEELFEELSDPEDFTLSTENEKLFAKGEGFSAVLNKEDFSLISAEFLAFGTKFTFSDFKFEATE